jgi:inhibitor of cysteine peptidase
MKYFFILFAMLISTVSYAELPVYTENKLAIQVSAHQPQFVIKLKSNRTTGFSWFLVGYNPNLIEPLKHVYQPPTSQLVGAPGYDVWTFNAKPAAFTVPRQTTIAFVYARPWEKVTNQKPNLVFQVSTS